MRVFACVALIAGGCGGTSIHGTVDGMPLPARSATISAGVSLDVWPTPLDCGDAAGTLRPGDHGLELYFHLHGDGTVAPLSELQPRHFGYAGLPGVTEPAVVLEDVLLDARCKNASVRQVMGGGVDVRSVSATDVVVDFDALFDDGEELSGRIDATVCSAPPRPASCD